MTDLGAGLLGETDRVDGVIAAGCMGVQRGARGARVACEEGKLEEPKTEALATGSERSTHGQRASSITNEAEKQDCRGAVLRRPSDP